MGKRLRKADKYKNYIYKDEINEMIKRTTLNELDQSRVEELMDNPIFKNKVYYNIIRDIYVLANKCKLSCYYLADIYNVTIRTVQIWLKELDFNRSIEDNLIVKRNKVNKEYDKNVNLNMYKDGEVIYALYRFLDKNRRVLYIGKCKKSYKGINEKSRKEYFVKDRIQHHFSLSSSHIPKSLYLNTKYIEVLYPNVSSNRGLEELESALVSYYERTKLECFYNKDLISTFIINEDNYNWEKYHTFNTSEINDLKKKYGFKDIPEIETINERLKAILWIMNNKAS